jgi:hypothetical protein
MCRKLELEHALCVEVGDGHSVSPDLIFFGAGSDYNYIDLPTMIL